MQVESVVLLLDEGNTVPFITRYRKERTGNLNEVTIREIQLRVQRLRELAERKETILKAIEAQGKLDPDLAAAIRAAENPKRLEDLYLPFKPKKRTKASDAHERGLEPLALRIWTRDETLTDVAAAAPGAASTPRRGSTRSRRSSRASATSSPRPSARWPWSATRSARSCGRPARSSPPRARSPKVRAWNTAITSTTPSPSQIPPHRVLAINRGDKEGPLKVRLEVSGPTSRPRCLSQLPLEGHPQHDLFHAAAIDALDRLILPSIKREVRRDLTEAAEKHAVEVFARNLGSLLLQPPIPKQVVLAIDPGFNGRLQGRGARRRRPIVNQAVIFPPSAAEPPRRREAGAQGHGGQAPGGRRGDRQRHGLPRDRGTRRRDHRGRHASSARATGARHRRPSRPRRARHKCHRTAGQPETPAAAAAEAPAPSEAADGVLPAP